MPTFIKAIFTHFALVVYFWIANWYSISLMNNLPMWLQVCIGIAYVVSLLVLFGRAELFEFSCNSSNERRLVGYSVRMVFYCKVFFWYMFVIGLPLLLLTYNAVIPKYLQAYFIFIFLMVLINSVDYSIPSYERYLRLTSTGHWGGLIRRGKA